MNAIQKPAPLRMTRDEFLAWEGDGIHKKHELVEGVVVAMAPASFAHGILQARLAGLLMAHLDAHRPGHAAATEAGLSPSVRAELNVRVPDVLVTTGTPRAGQILAEEIVLVAEILSPSNRKNTRAALVQYRTIASVRDIVMLHSRTVQAEVSHRGPAGWPDEPTIVTSGIIRLDGIGFSCPIEAIYANTGLV